MLSIVTRVLASVCGLCVVVPAEATLIGRLPVTPGGTDFQAAYDDVLDITWTTDAGLSGQGTWGQQVAWAAGFSLGGFDDWRLASMSVSSGVPTGTTTSVVNCNGASEAVCRDNELGYMFYHNLGGNLFDDLTGNETVDGVALTNIQSFYWSGTEFNSSNAWVFVFFNGLQRDDNNAGGSGYGWAVRSGDVAASVPEPGTVVLMGAGLAGLLGFGRSKRRR